LSLVDIVVVAVFVVVLSVDPALWLGGKKRMHRIAVAAAAAPMYLILGGSTLARTIASLTLVAPCFSADESCQRFSGGLHVFVVAAAAQPDGLEGSPSSSSSSDCVKC
jgi:hypothetical protein